MLPDGAVVAAFENPTLRELRVHLDKYPEIKQAILTGETVLVADVEQDPLYRLQAFASYDFTPATYGALRLIHADGGELRLGGERLDGTHQGYTQIGFELGHWLDQKNQLLFSLSRNVDTDNCYHGEQALLRLAHVF